MNRFGEIADELTDLIEELDDPNLAEEARALRAAIERAFAKACEAERVLRLKLDAAPRPAKPALRPIAAGPGRASTGVVIELPLAWRIEAARRPARRLAD